MNYIALDIETATGNRNSICQIGLVLFNAKKIIKKISYLVKPPNNEYFVMNTRVHGLNSSDTKDSFSFNIIWPEIKNLLTDNLIICHNCSFDIDCIIKTLKYYNINCPKFNYECTYNLTNKSLDFLVKALNIELIYHHDALSDAEACAKIYQKIINNSSLNYNNYNYKKQLHRGSSDRIKGNVLIPDLTNVSKDSFFYNKKVVFTGILSKISRKEAASKIKLMGADIDTSISKNTNFIILGDKPGPVKMKKVRNLISSGISIEIIDENKFLDIINK